MKAKMRIVAMVDNQEEASELMRIAGIVSVGWSVRELSKGSKND